MQSSHNVRLPKPQSHVVSREHQRGLRWFVSLTQILEQDLMAQDDDKAKDDQVSLQHSVQLYSMYAETGDEKFLELSEDFLKYTLDVGSAR